MTQWLHHTDLSPAQGTGFFLCVIGAGFVLGVVFWATAIKRNDGKE